MSNTETISRERLEQILGALIATAPWFHNVTNAEVQSMCHMLLRMDEFKQKAEIYDMLRADYELEGSLVDFVDWQAKRIEMLEQYTSERDAENQRLLITIGKLREERETHIDGKQFADNTAQEKRENTAKICRAAMNK